MIKSIAEVPTDRLSWLPLLALAVQTRGYQTHNLFKCTLICCTISCFCYQVHLQPLDTPPPHHQLHLIHMYANFSLCNSNAIGAFSVLLQGSIQYSTVLSHYLTQSRNKYFTKPCTQMLAGGPVFPLIPFNAKYELDFCVSWVTNCSIYNNLCYIKP